MNKKKKKKTHVPFRLNMVFFAVFVLFSMLILRLGIVQIVYGEDFKREIERTEDVTVNNPVPRGKMYDRNMKAIVDNTPSNAITYTKSQSTQTKEMLMVAERVAKLIVKDTENDLKKVRERDKKDYWILRNEERAREKITEKEWAQYEEKKLDDKAIYNLQLERITENELKELKKDDLEILAILREMMSGYALSPQIVKKDLTPEEFAIVSENLEMLPGVDTTTDWERQYSYDKTLKTILGKVSDSEKGLPKEKLEYYLARGYSRNDRVGLSYIEQQYEDVLHGQKAKVKNITDKGGNVLDTQVISEGQRGKDLVLTIDMDLQLAVDKIIEEELLKAKQTSRTGLLDRAFVVLMDPNTGEILTLAGKQIVKDEDTGKDVMQDFASGNFTTSYNVGSAVKGATILTGFSTGAISPGTQFYDTPIKIKGTNPKKSWKAGLGTLDDRNALKVSSNVYMFRTAINIGKGNYKYDQPLYLEPEAFDTMRNHFSQFGLGARTGIDLPNEMIGFKGTEKRPGLLLDFAIGQYDTYTPLQLAQYVSTIANGGNRIQPRIVKEIREPVMKNDEVGPVVNEFEPVILNKVDAKPEWFDRVQEGFRRVMQEPGGTAYGAFHSAEYKPAGKTGTAQAFYDGPKRKKYDMPPEVMNLSLVGYAPYDNPEIALAVMVPWAYEGNTGHHANNDIGRRVLDTYFDLKKKRMEGNMNPEQPIQEVEKKEAGTELLEEIAEDTEQ
ncbi:MULTISPECIES: penicillin-binding protein 2 [unclassified Mesobacillus]|uniref:peptidoglycan D,D-transpeptidase FtsI family protein n=1 Tax=unclassified Mesobacillus TaxID=2675270 RepID=UPI00203DFD8C|nr:MULTISPECIES: penicillin-binding protein 2 [unclassified Mesobacillus]MCM3122419.1 penicillin-binding protein 2 [Mesobacillus sp. MER 33]MCM3232383.1 penicillin-binding protein 2 [Mesobacillus sp. MER 48]